MECDFNLLCYGLFKILKKIIIFKALLSIKKKLYIFCDVFNMFYSIMIWNGKWKKMLCSISSKYSYFKPIFNYIKKGLWKETLISQNCDTLMCFRPYVYHYALPMFQGHPLNNLGPKIWNLESLKSIKEWMVCLVKPWKLSSNLLKCNCFPPSTFLTNSQNIHLYPHVYGKL